MTIQEGGSRLNKNQVKYGAVLSYILIALNALSGFSLSPFVLRCLGESEYGVYKAIAAMTATISIMELGLGGTMQRYIAKFNAEKNREAANNFSAMGMIEASILNVAILIVGMVLYTFIDRVFGGKFTATELLHAKQIYWILLINVVCHLFENTLFGIVTGYNRFVFSNSLKICLLALRVILYLVFLPIVKSAMILVSVILALEIITVICELLYLYVKLGHRIKLTKWNGTLFKESIIYALALFTQTLVIQFNGNIDNVLIGAFIGTAAVTVYSFAIMIFNMYESCATAISGVMLPTVMQQIEDGGTDRELENTIIKTGRVQWMVLGALLIGFICCGKEFFTLWLGAGYEDCWLLIVILLLPVTLHLITNVGLSVLRARNLMAVRTIYLLCSAVLNFLITALGIPKFGYWAAVAGTAAAAFVGDVVTLNFYYSKKLHLRVFHIYRCVLHKITFCLLLCGAVILLLNLFLGGRWLSLLIKILIFLVLYILLLFFFGFTKKEKQAFVKSKSVTDDTRLQKCRAITDYFNAALFDRAVCEQTKQVNAAEIFAVAKKNAIASVVLEGIRKSGTVLEQPLLVQYEKEAEKALFSYAMQLQQLITLCQRFEAENIPFIVLKGSRMRELYPSAELRTSSDIDILVRAEDDKLIHLMETMGFSFEKDGGTTLNFRCGAVIEVELHRRLFDDRLLFHGYFDTIWDRAVRVDGWDYQYRMTEEDFYVNMIAHFAKHFMRYGCGIRNAMDISVFLKNAPSPFSRKEAESILKEIGLADFERKICHLIDVWDNDIWTDSDIYLTDYILGCGLFGTEKTKNTHRIYTSDIKHGKLRYLISHVFPNYKTMCSIYPVIRKCQILLPFCWIVRGFRIIFFERNRISLIYSNFVQITNESVFQTGQVMQDLCLDNIFVTSRKNSISTIKASKE